MDLPEITTDRLVLRAPRVSDAPAVAQAVGNLAVSRWLMPVPHPYSEADGRAFLEAARAGAFGSVWMIEDSAGLCGCIALDDELGYWLAEPAWGRGYGTEAVSAVLAHHFRDPQAIPVTSGHFEGNARSGRILTRAGFGYTGRVETVRCLATGIDHRSHRLVLVPEHWHALNPWVIETDRLRLRPLTQADAADVARIGALPDVAPMILTATVPWPEAAVSRLIERARWRGHLGFRLGIELRGNGKLVGTVGISSAPNVFYFLDPAYWRQGVMTEALRAFLPEAMDRFDLAQIGADAFDDNLASQAVLTKLGFRHTGSDMGRSAARVEPAPISLYRLARTDLEGKAS